MTKEYYNDLIKLVMDAGYAHEIEWASNIKNCGNSMDFLMETCWVIINSGMKEQIARKIWERIQNAWATEIDISTVFKHKGKVSAIKHVYECCDSLFVQWDTAEDKIAFLQSIPYIGKITVWHLAKNLGMDVCKPDRHLVRVAAFYNTTPEQLCADLSKATGDRIATVDTVIWRACNLQII